MEQINLNKIGNIVLAVGVCLLLIKSCVDTSDKKNLSEQLSFSKTEYNKSRNKLGEEITKVQLLQTESKRNFLRYQSEKEEVRRLQQLIKKSKQINNATVLGNTTLVISKGATDTILVTDTILGTVYPTYTYSDSTKWYEVSLMASKDTTQINFIVKNEFEVTQTYKEIQVRNLNPYTNTDYIQTVTIDKKKGRVKTFLKGAGTGAIAVLIILALL